MNDVHSQLRVLHVLGSLGRGGAETWVTQVIKSLRKHAPQIQNDVLVHQPGGVYEADMRQIQSQIIYVGIPKQGPIYFWGLYRLLQQRKYDVVHSHLQLYSGVVLRVAHLAGVPVRIAHARNTSDGSQPSWWRNRYHGLMRDWIGKHATHVMGVSQLALELAFGSDISMTKDCIVMTGIDFTPFPAIVNQKQQQERLNLPDNHLILGHVGSFRKQKNHHFLIEIMAAVVQAHPNTILLLVGQGQLQPDIEALVTNKGLSDKVRFLGECDNVHEIMRAMDVFVMPSLHEGLPRVVLEAQASGLPCVVSDTITRECAATDASVTFVPLAAPIKYWADSILEQADGGRLSGQDAVKIFEQRNLTILRNAKILAEVYGRSKR